MFLTADLTAETAEPGGNIVITIDEGTNTLLDYKSRRKFAAQNGGSGGGAKFHGANGADTVLPFLPELSSRTRKAVLLSKICQIATGISSAGVEEAGWGNRHLQHRQDAHPALPKAASRERNATSYLNSK